MAGDEVVPRSRVFLWCWDGLWCIVLVVLAFFPGFDLVEWITGSNAADLPLPVYAAGLYVVLVAGPLAGRLVHAGLLAIPGAGRYLASPVRSRWLRRRVERWNPRSSLRAWVVFGGALTLVLAVAGEVLVLLGVFPGPDQGAGNLAWLAAAGVAIVTAVLAMSLLAPVRGGRRSGSGSPPGAAR